MKDIVTAASPTMTSREIAELTGKQHKNVLRDIDNLLISLGSELSQGISTAYEGDPANNYRYFVLDRDSTYCLMAGYDANARMRIIKRWQALESGEATPAIKAKPRQRQRTQLTAKMMIARAAKSMLRMSETSTIRMLASIAESEGIAPSFLPAYVDEPLTRAITPMLKSLGHDLGGHVASVVNPALAEMGILEHLERIGSRGQVKKFWSLTSAGLKYGRNETNPNNPRQTIPLFFVDRFPELLHHLETHIESRPHASNVVLVKTDPKSAPV